MKPILKLILLAAAYLLTYVLGSCTGLIHPACYAYVGAILPLLTAFIYLLTCATIRGFGAATVLNGFVFVILVLTIPVSILAMRLAERSLKKQTEGLK
jgi:hypothetical protein